jgi:hypothetical protein
MINQTTFLSALESAYEEVVKEHHRANELAIGTFTLEENPTLALLLIERVVSRQGKLDTLQQFFKRFQVPLKKPTAPTRNPELQYLFDKYNSKNRAPSKNKAMFRAMESEYQKAILSYEKRLKAFKIGAEYHESITHFYHQTPDSYLQYIRDAMGEAHYTFFGRVRTLYLPETHRAQNAYLVGRIGTGKSETLKTLVHHNVKDESAAVILLDPHNDLAQEVIRLKDFRDNGRLVFIDPGLSHSHTPALNPFDIEERSPNGINTATTDLYEIFAELISGSGAVFTLQMESVLKHCIKVLLTMGNRSILDLIQFMDKNRNEEYIRFALENMELETDREYFRRDFVDDTQLARTKEGIRTKLMSQLTDRVFNHFLTKPQSFDLKAEMEKKSVIVFNLSDDKSRVLGRFILAKIKNIALNRARTPKSQRVPTFVYCDESHLFITPSIKNTLTQARKFRVSLCMASQTYGQEMNSALKEIVSGCTTIKMTSKNANKSNTEFSAETKVDKNELENLRGAEFMVKIDSISPKEIELPGILVHPPEHLLGFKYAMSREDWKKERERQIKSFYVPLSEDTTTQPSKPTKGRRLTGKIDL